MARGGGGGGGGGEKRRFQEQSCTSELFKVIQDAISLILLCRTMYLFRTTSSSTCITLDVQSIDSGLIPGGQILNNRQTVFSLLVDPMDKNHKDPDTIDLNEPRHAQYMHKTWKKHQNTVNWVDINLALKRGMKFYQTRSNAIILQETLPAFCFPKAIMMESGEVIYEKVYMSPRPHPKISLKHDWMKELGSEVVQRPEVQVVQQSKKFTNQTNQIQTQIMMIERGHPLFAVTQVTRKEPPKHVPLMKARTSTLETKQIMIELGHPLFVVTQVTCKVASNQC